MGHAADGSLSPDGSLVTMMGHEINGPTTSSSGRPTSCLEIR